MKKILLILLLLPFFASAQIETYLVSPYGNIEFDSARVMTIDSGIIYVTPTMLSDSLAGVGGADSSIFATQYRLDSTRSGLDTRINLRVKYTDTSTMLTPYLRKVDTVSLSNRITSIDTNALTTNTPMSTTLDTVQRNGVNSALLLGTLGAMVNGAFTTNQDANINGVNVGIGGGGISSNTRVGVNSLLNNTTGSYNNANGTNSLYNNTTGINNNANGTNSLYNNTTGSYNNANGTNSLYNNTTGGSNNANGSFSLYSNTTGINNNANGYYSLYSNTTGHSNNASGTFSLQNNTTGGNNNASGTFSLQNNTTGGNNNASGYYSLQNNTTGGNNNASGYYSLGNNTTGGNNNASGIFSGAYITGGAILNTQTDNSVYLGANTKAQADSQTNQIVIGYDATGLGSNSAILGNSSISLTALRGSVLVNTTTNISSSQLTVESVSKGFLPPRMTTTQKNAIGSPTAGLLVYDLTLNKMCVYSTQWDTISTQTITFGTGVQTALGINIGSAGAPVLFNGALGTPSSGTLTNATGLPQSGVTNLTTDLGLKAPLANPTFTGTVTIPTPFTLGATSVTSTGTQLNYLSSATGTTGTTSTNLVFSTSPTLVTPNLGTPSTLVGTNITGTASGLTAGNVTTNANLTGVITSVGNATSIASQTGTGSKFVVDNTPTLITPVLGVASATSMNVGGGTLNGVVNALSTTDITLASTAHALTIGGASSSTNLVGGEYSTGVGLQARNNGAIGVLFLNPLGGDTRVGAAAPAGASNFTLFHVGTGTGDYAEISGRNGAGAAADGLLHRTFGTSWTTSGSNFQDGGASMTGTNLSGGYSIGTQASADLRFYSNNTLRTTIQAGGNTIHTARVELSKGANVASAGDLTLGSAGNVFTITGTTTINALTTTSWQAGSEVTLIFSGILTLKNNTAGGASTAKILTKTGADITTAANYVFKCVYDGTNWLQSN